MHEVHAETLHSRLVMRDRVQPARGSGEVETVTPMFNERAHLVQRNAARIGDTVRPSRPRKTLAQIVDGGRFEFDGIGMRERW